MSLVTFIARARAKGRLLKQDWQIQARRGIRMSGTFVVASGGTALLGVSDLLPSAAVALATQVLSLPSFGWFGTNLLVAVWQLDHKAGPVPECPGCRVALNVSKYKCGICRKSHSV